MYKDPIRISIWICIYVYLWIYTIGNETYNELSDTHYHNINATITNNRTGQRTFVDLTPHLNLIDNFHYARNIFLPGNVDDLYTVVFNVNPPEKLSLSFHKDWSDAYNTQLFNPTSFEYKKIDFEEIANSSRR